MRLFSLLVLLSGTVIATAQSPRSAPRSISTEEAREFGQELEREFRENGADFFVKALDAMRMVEIATTGQPGNDEIKEGFRTGVIKGGFGANIGKSMEGFSSYKLLRTVTTNERPQLVFRCLSQEQALNYHILELERSRSARIRIVDMFVMISGEKLSETLRRLYLVAAAEADRSLLTRLTQGRGDWITHGKEVQNLAKLTREGDSKGALKVYQSLPESIRSEKSTMVLGLMAASKGEEKTYLSIIETFEKLYPNDPSLALVSVDGFVLKKQTRRAIASIQKLDRFVGGDAYLLLLQAGQYVELKDRDKARELGRKALEQEPALASGYDFLLNLALEDKDYVETGRLLNLAGKNLKVDMLNAIQDEKEYAQFLQSPEGKKWKESQPAKAK